MASERHGDWKYFRRIDFDSDGNIVRYTINFSRRRNTDWYDEVRYDSHEFKRYVDAAVEEIKGLIDNQVEGVDKVLRR